MFNIYFHFIILFKKEKRKGRAYIIALTSYMKMDKVDRSFIVYESNIRGNRLMSGPR